MSILWQHPGWFSTDKGTFSGSDLVQNTMIWSLFQCKAQSGIVWVYWSGLLFITDRAACSFYLLTSTRRSVSPLLRDPAELHDSIQLFLLGYVSPRSNNQWVKKKRSHWHHQVTLTFSRLPVFELQLLNPLRVSASNSLPTPRATSNTAVFFESSALWHFRSWGVRLSSGSPKPPHHWHKAAWLIQPCWKHVEWFRWKVRWVLHMSAIYTALLLILTTSSL